MPPNEDAASNLLSDPSGGSDSEEMTVNAKTAHSLRPSHHRGRSNRRKVSRARLSTGSQETVESLSHSYEPGATSGQGPRCSYTEDCTTDSPLRKVVSHIFGRNKLCTRQIPKNAWVHYCRKHYQRSRYRNPRGFALLQCDLVRKQIDRLQLWGGVTDWMVKVRKREEERLNRESAEMTAAPLTQVGRRGPTRNIAGQAVDRLGLVGPRLLNGSWAWLVHCTGTGKTTMEVLQILDRIEQEIASSGSNFPDVEILPNVVERKDGIRLEEDGGTGRGAEGPLPPLLSGRRRCSIEREQTLFERDHQRKRKTPVAVNPSSGLLIVPEHSSPDRIIIEEHRVKEQPMSPAGGGCVKRVRLEDDVDENLRETLSSSNRDFSPLPRYRPRPRPPPPQPGRQGRQRHQSTRRINKAVSVSTSSLSSSSTEDLTPDGSFILRRSPRACRPRYV